MKIACLLILLLASPASGAPFYTCDYYSAAEAPDAFVYLMDEGPDWQPCEKETTPDGQVRMMCDLAGIPAGGHLLRSKAKKGSLQSPGNAWLFLYKLPWQTWNLYYVLKIEGDKISWELQAVK